MKTVIWKEPWESIDSDSHELESELQSEIGEGHLLEGKPAKAIARRIDCDDVLFKLSDESLVVVQLTWSSKKENDPFWPYTEVYDSLDSFSNERMELDATDYLMDY